MSIQVSHVLETVLYGPDLEAMERFYTGVLGFRKVGDFSPRGRVFRVNDASVLIVFDPTVTAVPSDPIPAHGAQGPGHVAFAIEPEELASWRKRLQAAGVAIEKEVDWPSALEPGGDVGKLLKRSPRTRAAARSIYFRDPAGNSVELITGDIWGR